MFAYLHDTTATGLGCMFMASFGAFLFGFDNGWWGTILGSPVFLRHYGSCTAVDGVETCNLSTQQLSLGSSIQSAGISVCPSPPASAPALASARALITDLANFAR